MALRPVPSLRPAELGERSRPETPPDRRVVAGEWGARDWFLRRGMAISDSLSLLGALALGMWLGGAYRPDFGTMMILGTAYLPVWLVLFKVYGMYERDVRRISHAVLDELPWLLHTVMIGALGLFVLTKIGPVQQLTMPEGVIFAGSALALALAGRALVRRVITNAFGLERLLVVGGDEFAPSLVSKLGRHPEYGVEPVGVVARAGDFDAPRSGLPVLGDLSDFERVVRDHDVERVLICRHGMTGDDVTDLIEQGRRLGVKVGQVPDTVDALGFSVEIDDVEGITILGINPPVLSRTSRMLKRGFDLTATATAALPLLILCIVVAIAIKLDSPGPVFFRQRRIGRGGRAFSVVKFRTMRLDAEQSREQLMAVSKDPNWLHIEDDPRVTRVGRRLRATSLDELPQLWNVLKGEMTLVGPRPLIPAEAGQVKGWARNRQDLTPGMTGLWQVMGRTDIPFEEMVKLDYLYVTNWTLWLDVKLLLRTFPAMLARRGAN